jgi:hypothetical protein
VESEVKVTEVRTFQTQGGNTRWVVRDEDGNEYTTFRPEIGRSAEKAEGSRARIEFHESKRGQYNNVYLDAIEALAGEQQGEASGTDPEEAAWQTAVEAAPWLVGESEPDEAVPPDELFEKLEPFKQRVSEDIRSQAEEADADS